MTQQTQGKTKTTLKVLAGKIKRGERIVGMP